MKIAVCGGTGFIGSALTKHWLEVGYEIVIITRRPPERATSGRQPQYVSWGELERDPQRIAGVDAVVNLSGESLNQRWTKNVRLRIMQSRVDSIAALAKAIKQLNKKPEVVIQASAMSFYGTSETETFDESSPHRPTDFPSTVAEQWEAAAEAFQDVRLVKLRISMVLGRDKGAFPLLKLPYLMGFGGRIGSGRQWATWIHITDMVRIVDFCLHDRSISGAVNSSAPNPVTNDDFGRTIASVYHRPHWFPVPAFLIKATLGEMSVMVLEGQKVIPKKLLDHGFQYQFPDLKHALEDLHTN
ncbi:TIGR01777 family oxidoreductase [Paenibacillus enshidis]|uniref:TIGR01777 family oxidoreductase n=1 Tax=Paenibacillus enshidis TaxID=1458439 RepID=A0ABV5ARW5_9BACL